MLFLHWNILFTSFSVSKFKVYRLFFICRAKDRLKVNLVSDGHVRTTNSTWAEQGQDLKTQYILGEYSLRHSSSKIHLKLSMSGGC